MAAWQTLLRTNLGYNEIWRDLVIRQLEESDTGRQLIVLRQGAEEVIEMDVGTLVDVNLTATLTYIDVGKSVTTGSAPLPSTNINALRKSVTKETLGGGLSPANLGLSFVTDISEIGCSALETVENAALPYAVQTQTFEILYRRSRTDPSA